MHYRVARAFAIAALLLGAPQLSAAAQDHDETITLKQAHRHALQLCEALHDLPARRKQECCGAQSASLAALCTTALTESLRESRARIDADAIDRCRKASARQLVGCAWVGPLQPDLPAACSGLIEGQIERGATCQSSLECRDGLYCQGVSPLAAGICAAPAQVGARCEFPADNLAVYTRAEGGPRHPSCEGVCLRGRCLAKLAEGGTCSSAGQCADGRNCIAGQCRDAPLFATDAQCASSTECAAGDLCIDAHCSAPKSGGASCRLPFECRSLECRKAAGEDSGLCVDACVATEVQHTPL
jgi:hypothetical protein